MSTTETRPIFLLLLFLSIDFCVNGKNVTLSGYQKWTIESNQRDDMYCEDSCTSYEHYDRCCSCNAKPCWEINVTACGIEVVYLDLEYEDIFGTSVLVVNNTDQVDLHVFEHTNGIMSNMPANLCDYNTTLTKLDLRYNRLKDIDQVRCLVILDILLLDNNLISSINSSTFSRMENLRVARFSNNQIKVLDPNTLSILNGNIHSVDFSNNLLEIVDVTNMIREGFFCELTYENNDLGNITNINEFMVDIDRDYGPGDTYLNNTNVGQFYDLSRIGIKNYDSVGLFVKGQIHIDSASIHCDCGIYPLFEGLGSRVLDYWPNLGDDGGLDFTCASPERMNGTNLKQMFENGNFSELTCDIVENCTDGCTCTDRPSENRIVVDCRNKNLQSFPGVLPVGSFDRLYVNLLLDDNSITEIPNVSYLDRIRYLQMPNNAIISIDNSIVAALREAEVNIEDQELSHLPEEFSNLDPHNIQFGFNPVQCTCGNLWIGNWIRAYDAREKLYCDANGIKMFAEFVTIETLDCLKEENDIWKMLIAISVAFLTAIFLICLAIRFRTELLLLKRKLIGRSRSNSPIVFISMCDVNDEIFSLVHYCLRPSLKHLQLQVKIPWYDVVFGEKRENHVSKAVSESNFFIILPCHMYLDNPVSLAEFDALWKTFLKDKQKDIVIVNWEGFSPSDIRDKRIRALYRTGYSIEFEKEDVRLMKRIAKRADPELNVEEIPPEYLTFPKKDHDQLREQDPNLVPRHLPMTVQPVSDCTPNSIPEMRSTICINPVFMMTVDRLHKEEAVVSSARHKERYADTHKRRSLYYTS